MSHIVLLIVSLIGKLLGFKLGSIWASWSGHQARFFDDLGHQLLLPASHQVDASNALDITGLLDDFNANTLTLGLSSIYFASYSISA